MLFVLAANVLDHRALLYVKPWCVPPEQALQSEGSLGGNTLTLTLVG